MRRLAIAARTYACVECGTERTCHTNHDGECYPMCKGSCVQAFRSGRGMSEQEHVLRRQTAHRYVREGKHDQPAPCDHDWQQMSGMGGLVDECPKCKEQRA